MRGFEPSLLSRPSISTKVSTSTRSNLRTLDGIAWWKTAFGSKLRHANGTVLSSDEYKNGIMPKVATYRKHYFFEQSGYKTFQSMDSESQTALLKKALSEVPSFRYHKDSTIARTWLTMVGNNSATRIAPELDTAFMGDHVTLTSERIGICFFIPSHYS